MVQTGSERIVLEIPVHFTAEELARLCRVSTDSAAFGVVEESLDAVNENAAPKAVIKWATVDRVEGDFTTVDGAVFQSKVVADKLKDTPRVFLSVITAGGGLEACGEFDGDPFLDTFNGALLAHATGYTIRTMKERFGFDGSSMLNPGSLPDWPIRNNFTLFDLIGNVEEIGVTIRENGYMKPWNTTSHIHFSGHGYQNCSLCRKYDCVGRRAKFDHNEYVRIFGTEP